MVIYNLYFHPLSKFPGSKLWTATRLTYIRSLSKGDLVHDVQKLHIKYGNVVRVAPDEVSFAKGEAWREIFTYHSGRPPFPKNPTWWAPPLGQVDSLISVPDEGEHSRMRVLLSHGFTESALRAQESVIQSYVDLLIYRLHELVTGAESNDEGAVVDMVLWYNYTAFDIVGDLGFGEPFNCLRDSSYHPWVALIFTHFKATALTACVRMYPIFELILEKMLPKSVLKAKEDHFQLAVGKVHRRLNLETQRDDFMSHVIKHNKKGGMTIEEIEATFNLIIIAGSETTGTALSGITNNLVRNPTILHALQSEVRSAFPKEEEITFAALRDLSYLNAVIEEGLRMCPPAPASLSRVAPKGGDTVCGHFLPENVSHKLPSTFVSLRRSNNAFRRLSPSINGQSPIHPKTSIFLPPLPLPAGSLLPHVRLNSTTTSAHTLSRSASGQEAASVKT